MSEKRLKKCPWCDQNMTIRQHEKGYYVTDVWSMRSCMHRRHIFYPSYREAFDAWNDGTTQKRVEESD